MWRYTKALTLLHNTHNVSFNDITTILKPKRYGPSRIIVHDSDCQALKKQKMVEQLQQNYITEPILA